MSNVEEEKITGETLFIDPRFERIISGRTRNSLDRYEFHKLSDLHKFPVAQLLKLRNIGRKTINEVQIVLEKADLSLDFNVTRSKDKSYQFKMDILELFEKSYAPSSFTEEEYLDMVEFIKKRTYFKPDSATQESHTQS
jgi:hypothetical protein